MKNLFVVLGLMTLVSGISEASQLPSTVLLEKVSSSGRPNGFGNDYSVSCQLFLDRRVTYVTDFGTGKTQRTETFLNPSLSLHVLDWLEAAAQVETEFELGNTDVAYVQY